MNSCPVHVEESCNRVNSRNQYRLCVPCANIIVKYIVHLKINPKSGSISIYYDICNVSK